MFRVIPCSELEKQDTFLRQFQRLEYGGQFIGDVLHQEVIRVLEGQLNVVLSKRSSIWSPISNVITWFLFDVQELGIRLKPDPLSSSSSSR